MIKSNVVQPLWHAGRGCWEFFDTIAFSPRISPLEMTTRGVFGGNYFGNQLVLRSWEDYVHPDFLADCAALTGGSDHLLVQKVYDAQTNHWGVKCGQDFLAWTANGWIRDQDPYGWFNWYINFFYGRRSVDDSRQIRRWGSFVGRHSGMLKSICQRANKSIDDGSCGQKTRQGLLHWAHKI